jgi:hypothetical protein
MAVDVARTFGDAVTVADYGVYSSLVSREVGAACLGYNLAR